MTTDDMDLVREYARHNSEEAFATLVTRHLNLVYSVALRHVRDVQLAEEITQVAFIILARKAKSLNSKTILPGWLCRTAHYVSARALTIQQRRQTREQEAYMQSVLNEPESTTWTQIAPLLDTALAQLGEKDHDAIVLRFFQNKSLNEIGAAMGTNEATAKKRVSRALEKLRKFFAKSGVPSTTAIIAGEISAHSVQAAPTVLAKSVTAIAIAKGAAASGSALTLIKGAMKLMAWEKAKTTIVAGVAILLAIATTTVVVKTTNRDEPSYQGQPVAASLVLSPLISNSQSNSVNFVAYGTLVFTMYRRDGKPEQINQDKPTEFRIERINDRWGIRTVQNNTIFTGGTDGKESYGICVVPDPSCKLGNSVVAIANISPGSYCTSASPWENMVLFAFTTPQSATKAFPAPWLDTRDDALAHVFSLECDRRLSSGLPEHAKFLVRASKFAAAVRNQQSYVRKGDPRTDPEIALKPYEEGFVGADYKVSDKTNFHGLELPVKFCFTQFLPWYQPSAPFVVFEGTVTNIETSTGQNLIPESPSDSILSVTDYRFHDSNVAYINYYATNEWRSETDPRLVTAFKEARTRAARKD